jgi:chemotaxis protein CheX
MGPAVSQVFATMLGAEVASSEIVLEGQSPEPGEGIFSFIGIVGSWTGTGSVICSSKLACRICSRMLMSEATSVNEEVLDAIAELTNMVIGNIKTDLETLLGPLGLSIPTVVFGHNFTTRTGGAADWVVQRFGWDGEELTVRMCLSPSEKHAYIAPHSHSPVCPLEI